MMGSTGRLPDLPPQTKTALITQCRVMSVTLSVRFLSTLLRGLGLRPGAKALWRPEEWLADPARARNAFQRLPIPPPAGPTMVLATPFPWEHPEGLAKGKDEGRVLGSKSEHRTQAPPGPT